MILMRSLEKNKRKISYALPTGANPIKDEWGNDTLEVERTYSDFVEAKANYSAAVGEEAVRVFGSLTSYSRVISVAEKSCAFAIEGTLVRLGEKLYEVVKVADSINGYLLAVREVV